MAWEWVKAAHMINQILPLLLTESTRQGIAKHNAMEAVLTRHLCLNRRKLMKSQAQEQVEDIIVDQTVMCLAQYADKNSLRDIEASLNALAVTHKLYHCGISYAVPRNTLAKANELRDWHIYAELGQVLIKKVRPLYAKDSFRLDIDNMVYAFDSSHASCLLHDA